MMHLINPLMTPKIKPVRRLKDIDLKELFTEVKKRIEKVNGRIEGDEMCGTIFSRFRAVVTYTVGEELIEIRRIPRTPSLIPIILSPIFDFELDVRQIFLDSINTLNCEKNKIKDE